MGASGSGLPRSMKWNLQNISAGWRSFSGAMLYSFPLIPHLRHFSVSRSIMVQSPFFGIA